MRSERDPVRLRALGRGERLRLEWGILWRGIAVAALAFLAGGLASGVALVVFNALVRLAGGDPSINSPWGEALAWAVGALVTLAFARLYVRWLLRARYGRLRLTLTGDGS